MPLKIQKRGKIWHYSGTVSGRRLRGTTGTIDKATAQRFTTEIERKAWQRRFDGPGAELTMAQVFNAYLDAGKSDRFLIKLADYWKETPVTDMFPESVRRAAKRIYPTASEPTWNRQVIKPTQAAINHCAALGWCSRISVKRYTENPKEKTPATMEWVQAFAEQATKDGLPHLAALCVFMFGTAARIGESCRLRWADIDLQTAKAKLYLFKPTPWQRTAHLPPELVAIIANIPSNRKPDEVVFGYSERGSVRQTWNNVIKRANIEQLSPHCCRHGFATTMLQKGFDVKTVADLGGWKDATTVLRTYAHSIKDKTVTNSLFDTPLTQDGNEKRITDCKERKIR